MAQFVLLLFGSVLLALSLSQEMSPRCLQLAVQKTNGCSVPAGLWAPYKNTFTPACYKHDFCYFCVRITLTRVTFLAIILAKLVQVQPSATQVKPCWARLGTGRVTRHEYRHIPNFVPLKAESSVPAIH